MYAAFVDGFPFFATGFFAFAFMRLIFSYLKMDNPDSIGKEFEEVSEKYHA